MRVAQTSPMPPKPRVPPTPPLPLAPPVLPIPATARKYRSPSGGWDTSPPMELRQTMAAIATGDAGY